MKQKYNKKGDNSNNNTIKQSYQTILKFIFIFMHLLKKKIANCAF